MELLVCGILAALLVQPIAAYISGAFVLPHGSIAQAPQHFNTTSTGAQASAVAKAQASTLHSKGACVVGCMLTCVQRRGMRSMRHAWLWARRSPGSSQTSSSSPRLTASLI